MSKLLFVGCALLLILVLTLRAVAADPADAHPDLHLIPWPKVAEVSPGQMKLTADSRIVVADDGLKPLAEVLAGEIALLTSLKLPVAAGASRAGDIVLKLNPSIRAGEQILVLRNREPVRTTDGAYAIRIDREAVIEGFDYRATAEGTSTILQLVGKTAGEVTLPKIAIRDWPHADYCGVMLDVGRQDHPIEAVKKVVELCRLYKARYLQLHLTDDQGWTFPSTKYPKLGSKNYGAHGGIAPRVYKLDALKELVAFADARGVTLVPEMEVPGHSGAALRSLPEIFDAIDPVSRQPVGMGCMNMSNEAIYPALDTIIGEMCDVFKSSPFFHIGSDEVSSGRLSLHPGYKAFMDKHRLKDDHQLADHFISEVCAIVKKHGKKAIKWEGLSNTATKDVIIMAWEGNSNAATDLLARGWTTITCPWNLGVPWEEWSMYRCNASQLKKGDSVLGATLVAWEQPPQTHIANLRNLASRQERTWGPDNSVTVEGFASRFQPLDAVAGRLIEIPAKGQTEADFTTSAGICDFLDPVFAFDGNDATFFKSAVAPQSGDHFTVTFKEPISTYAIEVLTGINGKGLFSGGEVQVSTDGSKFVTVATLDRGAAKALLSDNRVRAIRLHASVKQSEPLVVRAINLRRLVEVSGKVPNPSVAIGEGNVAVTKGDTTFAYPLGVCLAPVINRDFTLALASGGNPANYSGPISGTGKVEIYAGGPAAPLVLDGKGANTMRGTWSIKAGRVVLAKEPGVDALGGTIVVGGQGAQDSLFWNAGDQVSDTAQLELLKSDKGAASLHLNGFSDSIGRLTLHSQAMVYTDGPRGGGVLTVRELVVEGKSLPAGVYTSTEAWLRGGGYLVVGEIKRVDIAGSVDNPVQSIGSDSVATLKAGSTVKLPEGDFAATLVTGDFPLTLGAGGRQSKFNGFITGNGAVRIEAAGREPLEISGRPSNSYKGGTVLARGVLKLSKPAGAVAIPGNLTLGGSAEDNKEDGILWAADGQLAPSAVVTLEGTQPSYLDLAGHKVTLGKVVMSQAGQIRTGSGGALSVKQLYLAGKRLPDGVYKTPLAWLAGTGVVTIDSRVAAQGVYGAPHLEIGQGNIANLTGDAKFAYPMSACDNDIITNGFTVAFDSGNGNPLVYSGSVSGKGNVEFFMGPTYTDHRDAPLQVAGEKANTATGKFLVRKGRVQLEKPPGVDAISGDVIVGGQGFNDCLFWKESHQLKDSVAITLIDAGNSGAAYLHLNGCSEVAASLSLTPRNKVKTDSAAGKSGELTVKALTIGGALKPAGEYTASTEKWIEGLGKVIVRP